jgi:hypothetical protein
MIFIQARSFTRDMAITVFTLTWHARPQGRQPAIAASTPQT